MLHEHQCGMRPRKIKTARKWKGHGQEGEEAGWGLVGFCRPFLDQGYLLGLMRCGTAIVYVCLSKGTQIAISSDPQQLVYCTRF